MVLYLTLGKPEMTRKELGIEENCRTTRKEKMVPSTVLVPSLCTTMNMDCVLLLVPSSVQHD